MSVSVGDSNTLPSPKMRDLGVILNECLTLDAHISNICRRAHFYPRSIGISKMLLSFEAASHLIHALITTTLDYCNGIQTVFKHFNTKLKSAYVKKNT